MPRSSVAFLDAGLAAPSEPRPILAGLAPSEPALSAELRGQAADHRAAPPAGAPGRLRESSMGPVAKRRRFRMLTPAPRHFFGLFYFDGNRTKSGPAFGVGPIAIGLILGIATRTPMFHARRFIFYVRTFLSHAGFGHGILLWCKPLLPLWQSRSVQGKDILQRSGDIWEDTGRTDGVV